ncbi:sel1 repeat family protein [Sphingopyxis sp. OPL5]|uniref:tetratricopeptide repeat protein n=1 Tax=Sphingopyxis sp. OPL5 TaxID=2486273 RepID=UPI00164ECC6F|nr:tetratricopeptide repeat protein [Sphingopyxis sp. OPL5]QNO28461.1 sel1 repeat family protein [Sphingopyxis sp. OPL5]
MRMILTFAAPLLALATASSTLSAGGAMPDPTREYNQNVDCHNAYDRLVAEKKAGTSPSAAALVWAQSYEAGANAGTPCPAPLPEMTARGGNWYIRTTEGRDAALAYAQKQKDPAALSEIGHAWINSSVAGGTPQDGLALIEQAADLGDPVALYSVGTLYGAGIIGGKKDPAKAFELLSQSAAAGHIDAIYRTGLYYLEGIGTKKDPKKAFAAFKSAAERGHFYAVIMAFDMINSGTGTRKDFDLAYRLSRIVADQGEPYGAVMAASSLLQLKNPLPHEDEILYWMDEGIARGDDNIRGQLIPLRAQVVGAFTKSKAPPEYKPRVFKACPMKTVCLVNHYSGLQSCTTNKDYWSDCDG